MSIELSVRTENHGNIHISDHDDKFRLSVWILHGHAGTYLNRDQVQELIEALQTALQEQTA